MGCRVACRKILNVLKKEISKSKDKRIQNSSVEEICDDLQKMAAQVIQNVQTHSPAKVWYSTVKPVGLSSISTGNTVKPDHSTCVA